jgi:pimeloyl-ACP methyl ester carboxylesterase
VRKIAAIVLFTILTLVIILQSSRPTSARPVVVIPGIEGSQLCARSGDLLWGDRNSYEASRIGALRIPFGANGKDSGIHPCGLITTVNIIPLFYQSDVYSSLLKTLHDLDYTDQDIVVFDYDWRLSNFENAAKLRDFIDRRLPNPTAQVDIAAHSMGGIIARIYIQTLGGENRVQNVIFLGTPHLGSAKVFKELKSGFDSWPNALSGGLAEIQRTILSFPSTYQLLPTYDQCCGFSNTVDPVHSDYVDILTPSIWKKFNWLPDEFKSGNGYDFLSSSLAEAKRLKNLLSAPIFQSPANIGKLHFVANGFIDTWSRVFFNPSTGEIVGSTLSPGDGTVLLFSATNGIPNQFQLSPLDHEHIFAGREAALVLNTALSGQIFHHGSTGFSQDIRDDANNPVTVNSAQFELDRRVVTPTSMLTVTLTLKGPAPIKTAPLSTLSAQLLRDDGTLSSIPLTNGAPIADGRIFQQQFAAPAEPGAYKIRLSAPGLEPIETIFAVMIP